MQLTAKEDIDGPIDRVFAMLTDFEGYERAAMRRGAEVSRSDTLRLAPHDVARVGMAWNARFNFRGRERTAHIKLAALDAPNSFRVDFTSPNLDGDMMVELLAMSRNRTRVSLVLEVRPKTLAARLMMQSLKLARGNITKRFALRVADFAKDIEDRLRGAA